MDVLENKFSLLIRLEHFPALVASTGIFSTRSIRFNNTRWFISIHLFKYCQTSGEYIILEPNSSDQPETLGAYIYGSRADVGRYGSFVVEAQIEFKQVPTARGDNFTHKFCLNSSNGYNYVYGTPNLATIDVAFIFPFLLNLNCI